MPKHICWFHEAWDDYLYWQSQDKKTLRKINKLIMAVQRDPFQGEGSPEPLKANLAGYWSRRIDHKNRLVYAVEDEQIFIISCRFHYFEG